MGSLSPDKARDRREEPGIAVNMGNPGIHGEGSTTRSQELQNLEMADSAQPRSLHDLISDLQQSVSMYTDLYKYRYMYTEREREYFRYTYIMRISSIAC